MIKSQQKDFEVGTKLAEFPPTLSCTEKKTKTFLPVVTEMKAIPSVQLNQIRFGDIS